MIESIFEVFWLMLLFYRAVNRIIWKRDRKSYILTKKKTRYKRAENSVHMGRHWLRKGENRQINPLYYFVGAS